MSFLSALRRFFSSPEPRDHFGPETRWFLHEWPRVASLDDLLPDPTPPPKPRPFPPLPEPEPESGSSIRFQRPALDDNYPGDPSTEGFSLNCDVRGFCNAIVRGVNAIHGGDAVAFYRAAGITRSVYSRLISHPERHPSKDTALAMAAALHMDLPAAEEFLKLAGYALSPVYIDDQVWRQCFQRGIHELARIRELIEKARRKG